MDVSFDVCYTPCTYCSAFPSPQLYLSPSDSRAVSLVDYLILPYSVVYHLLVLYLMQSYNEESLWAASARKERRGQLDQNSKPATFLESPNHLGLDREVCVIPLIIVKLAGFLCRVERLSKSAR